jgi:hypothetical protein
MSGQPRWIPALVVTCELLTIATGFVVGYVSVWFQLFGETADREDYLVSMGGYAAGAAAGLIGLLSLRRLAVAPWVFWMCCIGALCLVPLALASYTSAQSAERDSVVISPWTDGAGGVLACPWVWVVVVLGLLALLGRGPARVTAPAAPPDAP